MRRLGSCNEARVSRRDHTSANPVAGTIPTAVPQYTKSRVLHKDPQTPVRIRRHMSTATDQRRQYGSSDKRGGQGRRCWNGPGHALLPRGFRSNSHGVTSAICKAARPRPMRVPGWTSRPRHPTPLEQRLHCRVRSRLTAAVLDVRF